MYDSEAVDNAGGGGSGGGGGPHKSQKWIYKIYNVAQLNKLLLVQLNCYVKRFSWSKNFTRFITYI